MAHRLAGPSGRVKKANPRLFSPGTGSPNPPWSLVLHDPPLLTRTHCLTHLTACRSPDLVPVFWPRRPRLKAVGAMLVCDGPWPTQGQAQAQGPHTSSTCPRLWTFQEGPRVCHPASSLRLAAECLCPWVQACLPLSAPNTPNMSGVPTQQRALTPKRATAPPQAPSPTNSLSPTEAPTQLTIQRHWGCWCEVGPRFVWKKTQISELVLFEQVFP